jgi:type III secretory pathway lipoprotein EscJ
VLAVPLRFTDSDFINVSFHNISVIMVVMSFSDIDGENKEQGENHQHVSSTMAVHRTHGLLILLDRSLSFCSFSFGLSVVCLSSYYGL